VRDAAAAAERRRKIESAIQLIIQIKYLSDNIKA